MEADKDKTRAATVRPGTAPGAPVGSLPGRVHTWPYLVRLELLATLFFLVVLTVWSITLNAPLEEMADPKNTPNPSKAPWYFLGLQELLTYFDAWMAGGVLPLLIIVGLMLIPYLDNNPRGSGVYTLRQRPFAVPVVLFGFLFLWILPMIVGTFFRGPGWNFFWPWEPWDPHKVVAHKNLTLGELMGIAPGFWRPVVEGMVMAAYWPGLAILGHVRLKERDFFRRWGAVRYHIISFFFLLMMLIPIKIFFKIFFEVKYFWVTPYFKL